MNSWRLRWLSWKWVYRNMKEWNGTKALTHWKRYLRMWRKRTQGFRIPLFLYNKKWLRCSSLLLKLKYFDITIDTHGCFRSTKWLANHKNETEERRKCSLLGTDKRSGDGTHKIKTSAGRSNEPDQWLRARPTIIEVKREMKKII